jgi:hypothetical protein
MQLEALLARNVDFMIHRGVMSPFTETWVFVSHAKVPFNDIEMDQYLNLTFARTREEALRHFPRHNGALSLGLLLRMFSDYIIVGELPTGEVWDISRTGMIKNVSEFKEFLFSHNIRSLGSLGGTPAARALKRAAAQATTKAKAKASAATKRRDAYMNAFNSMYAAPPRAQSVDNVAEEAFGNSDHAAANEIEDGDEEAADAHDDAAEDADNGSLEELVESIDDDEVIADEVDNWVACSRCNEWRIVPSGQFLTFQQRDVKFYCSLVGASCQLAKKRRRG